MARTSIMARRSLAYFTPDQLTGLTLWLKADSITANDGDALSTWSDSSGNGNDATNSGAAGTKPAYKLTYTNGKPAVTFDGGDGFTVANEPNFDIETLTAFIVATRASGSGAIMGKSTTLYTDGRRRKLQFAFGATSFVASSGSDGTSVSVTVTTTAVPAIYSFASSSNTSHKFNYNGTNTNSTTTLSESSSNFNNTSLLIGSNFAIGTEGFIGDVAEIILFNRALSDDEIMGVMNYLAVKYNVINDVIGGYPRSVLPIYVPAQDTFTRANSTTTLGSTEIGNFTWQNLNSNTGGISSNTAYSVTGANNQASYIEFNVSDVDITVTVSTYGAGVAQQGLYVRISDGNNFWRFTNDNGNISLIKKVAGSNTTFGTQPFTKTNGDVYRIVTSGDTIECFINGRSIIRVTDSFNNTATKHGFGNATGNSAARWDNFQIKKTGGRSLATGRTTL